MDIAREICTDSFYTVNSGLPRVPLTAVLSDINIDIFWNLQIDIDIDIFQNLLIDIDIDIDISQKLLVDIDIDIDIS